MRDGESTEDDNKAYTEGLLRLKDDQIQEGKLKITEERKQTLVHLNEP